MLKLNFAAAAVFSHLSIPFAPLGASKRVVPLLDTMGCGKSKVADVTYRAGMDTQTYFTVRVWLQFRILFYSLNMRKEEALSGFVVFANVDKDRSGVCSLQEFHEFFNVYRTRFTERVFSVLDKDRSGELDFKEFLAGVWNYCTMSFQGVAQFAFNIYDYRRVGSLTGPECESMVRMLYGKDECSGHARKIIGKAEKAGRSGRITFDDWVVLCGKYSALLKPAFDLQSKLQNRVMGASFWKTASRYRAQYFKEDDSIFDMVTAAERRDEDGMRVALEAEYDRAAELEDEVKKEIEEEEQAAIEAYESEMTAIELKESRMKLELTQAKRAVRQEFKKVQGEGLDHPVDVLLKQPDLVRAVRKVEKLLENLPELAMASLQEQEQRALQEARDDAWEMTRERFAKSKGDFKRLVAKKVTDYRDMTRLHGEEASREIISMEAFEKAGKTDVKYGAEQQVMMDTQKEMAAEAMDDLRVKFREQAELRRREYSEEHASILRALLEVDDSMVDYVNIWRRRFDPVELRYVWFAPRTDVTMATVPEPGQENADYLEMKKFEKYGIRLK